MRGLLLALAGAVSLFLTSSPAQADDPVIVDLRIDSPAVVTVGDHIDYSIVLEVDVGTPVALAAATLPAAVELVNPPETVREPLTDNRERVTISFQLAPFVAGELLLPPLPVRYTRPDGSSGVVETASSVIDVTSVLPAAGEVTPRDLKPQAEVGTRPPAWPLPVLIGLLSAVLVLVLAAGLRRRFSRYQATRALRPVPVLSGPEDLARRSLDQAAAEFSVRGDMAGFYGSLGVVVRDYLTQRYDFPAYALTTRELEAAMLRRGLDRWQVRVGSGLLSQCDAVVYAGYRPAAERADADLTAAYEVVEMSRPDQSGAAAPAEVLAS